MSRKYTIPTVFTEEHIDRTYTGDLSGLNQLIGSALAQEPVEGGALTIWVGSYWGNPHMTRDEAMTALNVTPETGYVANLRPGSPNPFFRFIDSLNQSGNAIKRSGDTSVLVPINEDDIPWMASGRCVMLVTVGGDAEGLPVYAEVDPAAQVPEGLPGREQPIIDEATGEQTGTEIKTWDQWKAPTHTFLTRSGRTFVSLVYGEKYLKATEWVPLLFGGLPVLTKTELLAIPAEEEPTSTTT